MKIIALSIALFSTLSAFAQNVTKEDIQREIEPLVTKIKILESEKSKLKSDVGNLSSQLFMANARLDSLQKQTQANSNAINETSQELGLKISTTETNANQKIFAVDQSLGKNSLLGIIGVLATILLSGLLYWLLSKRQKSDKSDFIDQLSKTKSNIEESLVKEFGKQTELMETQIQLMQDQKNRQNNSNSLEIDHSLALKVADEITLIERNMSLMDPTVKGLKQLARSVSKLKDNLNANGYELPELLGKTFNQGMKVIVVSSTPDENLAKDSEVITKVIKPQVNYQDKMIQAAQIEVSVGY